MSFLKNLSLMGPAFLITLAWAVSPALAANLTIQNGSASEIHAIYISDSKTNDWEENIIDGYMLPSGNELTIQISGGYGQFDLRVEDANGNYEDYANFPGKTSQITISGEGECTYK